MWSRVTRMSGRYAPGARFLIHADELVKQLFQVIRIDGERLTFEARTPTGLLYDAFELRKRTGAPDERINVETNTAD